jgi:hypothetical protein
MKTGRRRRKPEQPTTPQPASRPPSAARQAAPAPQQKRSKVPPAVIIFAVFAVIVCLIVGLVLCSGPRRTATEYLPADASGSWVSTVRVMAPELTVEDRFRTDCEADANCTVVAGTCNVRDREDRFTERVVDDYDDYAYNIYFEEAERQLYEASGQDFVVTELNPPEDRWEGERHFVAEEWLDEDTCQYTQFTVWITDPDNSADEIEVVLSECEVWDHVVVTEKVYEQEEFCRAEIVGPLIAQDTLTRRGTGDAVAWASAAAPAAGELQRAFTGTVRFEADGVTHEVQVHDADAYARYMTVRHYLGVDEAGNFVRLADQAE